jgi:mannose-1-phosphate guanylyltransferase
VDKLVFGRYCVDKTGATIDLQAAALDWLITDARHQHHVYSPLDATK